MRPEQVPLQIDPLNCWQLTARGSNPEAHCAGNSATMTSRKTTSAVAPIQNPRLMEGY
jgi:hypothetical protein